MPPGPLAVALRGLDHSCRDVAATTASTRDRRVTFGAPLASILGRPRSRTGERVVLPQRPRNRLAREVVVHPVIGGHETAVDLGHALGLDYCIMCGAIIGETGLRPTILTVATPTTLQIGEPEEIGARHKGPSSLERLPSAHGMRVSLQWSCVVTAFMGCFSGVFGAAILSVHDLWISLQPLVRHLGSPPILTVDSPSTESRHASRHHP